MKNMTQVQLGKLTQLGARVDFCLFVSQDEKEEYFKLNDIEALLGICDVKDSVDQSSLIEYEGTFLVKRSSMKALTESLDLKTKKVLEFSLDEYNDGSARPFLCSLNNFTPVDPFIVRTFSIGGVKRLSPEEETSIRKKLKASNDLTIDVQHSMENLPSLTNMLDNDMRRQSINSVNLEQDLANRRKSMAQDELRNISMLKQQMYMKRGMPPFGLNTSMKPEILTPSKSSPGMSSNGMPSGIPNGMPSGGPPLSSTPMSGSPKPTVKQMFLPMFDKLCEYMDAQTSRIDVSLTTCRNSEKGLYDIRKQFKDFADNMNNNFLVELKKILVSVDSRLRKLERASLLQTPASDDMKFFSPRKSSLRE